MFSYGGQVIRFADELNASREKRREKMTHGARNVLSALQDEASAHGLWQPTGADFLTRLQEAEDRDTESLRSNSSSSSTDGLASPASSCSSLQTASSPLASISSGYAVHDSNLPSRSAREACRKKLANHRARAAKARGSKLSHGLVAPVWVNRPV